MCKSYQAIVDFEPNCSGFAARLRVGAYAVLSKETPPAWEWVAGLFGFMVTLGLFLYELRGLQRAAALEQVGRELETEIGLRNGQFQEQPAARLGGFVDPKGAAWVIYPTVEASWLYPVSARPQVLTAAIVAFVQAIAIGWWMARPVATRVLKSSSPRAFGGNSIGRA